MSDRILTLAQVVEEGIVPLSKSSLYRIAEEGAEDSPFWKRSGRWMTVESDLFDWVRSGQRGRRQTGTASRVNLAIADIERRREKIG